MDRDPDLSSSTLAAVSPVPAKGETWAQRYFRYRGWTPIPLYAALVVLPPWAKFRVASLIAGIGVVLAGCALRLWAIRHIGRSARTRTEKTRPIVREGPYAALRNPLYASNLVVALGFTMGLGHARVAPLAAALLFLHYHLVVLCEEIGMRRRHGHSYEEYLKKVPRWIPRLTAPGLWTPAPYSVREALYRERSGILGISIGLAVLVARLLGAAALLWP